VGRFAFWVDDEASKLNINSANQRASTDILGASSSNVDLTVLGGIAAAKASASFLYATNTGYFTVEQWQMASGISLGLVQSNQYFLTAYSTDSGQTPWGTQKFYLNTNFPTFLSEIDSGGTNTLGCSVRVELVWRDFRRQVRARIS